MILLKGKYSGFCFGVKRAVNEAYKLNGENNFVLGEIIHNETVNARLKERGIRTIDGLEGQNLKRGDNLLIRTHGEPEKTFIKAKEMGLNVIDCTCPFVKDIQNIVKKRHEDGYKIVIIGKANHPEVVGINGWCNGDATVVDELKELNSVSAEKICIVVQTTYSEEKFDYLIKNFNQDGSKTVDIFKTICYTTTKRQKEAELIAKKSDAVLVLGGANSNNTSELYDICRKNCGRVFRIVYPSQFDYEKIKNFNKVGVVFGASTPMEQFMEVVSFMENITEEVLTSETTEKEELVEEKKTEISAPEVAPEEAAAQKGNEANESEVAEEKTENSKKSEKIAKSEMEKAFENIKSKDFKVGQIVSATISSVKDTGLNISLKYTKKDFDIPKEELLSDNAEDYQVGADIRVMVIAKSPVKFSEKAMAKILAEEADIKEIAEGKIFEAEITETNKGGLVGKYGSYQVFVPASQIKMGFVKDLEKYVGKTLRLKAEKVESRGQRRQIVGSQRVVLEAEKAERDAIKAEKEAEFFGNIEEGDVVLGTPVRFAAFGAFIDVNGFDCLAHISDLSWTGCNQCSDVLELGKEYEFKILKIDEENKRVSVGYKQLQPKPWDSVKERYSVGDVIKGKVVRIVKFGAFVEVEKGIDGLVHVSEISNKWLENPVGALQIGQEVDVKILSIDPDREKMNLSIKALLTDDKTEKEEPAKEGKKPRGNKNAEEETDLREWKDDDNGGASIAEMINDK